MAWRVAKSLETLRSQVNTAHPDRRKDSDGTIGDEAHATRNSDHNPWVQDGSTGVVTALDITHDPAHGVDTYAIAETLRKNRDARLKYIISNRRIFSSQVSPWEWRPYNGTNPHDQHVHISVLSDKKEYDDTSPWKLEGITAPAQSVLQKGATGPDVVALQARLGIPADGTFGSDTEAAVKAFQGRAGLVVDGIVGAYTWRALESGKQTNITAAVFGGENDLQNSAYDGHRITDTEPGVALPYRFTGTPPTVKVTNTANGKFVNAPVIDVGPWNRSDPYWTTGARPQAESGIDLSGRRTNKSGIDLTIATAAAIGLDGKGVVDWEFVTPTPGTPTELIVNLTIDAPAGVHVNVKGASA